MKRALLVLQLFPILLPLKVESETLEGRGSVIMREVDRRDTGWKDCSVDMEMVLRNQHGQESHRHMRMKFLETSDDGDKSLGLFDEPPDIQGTAVLTHSHKTENDDQWLYLPALKRVKRIASADKSGSFMGSEFAYEDLSSQELEKHSYKFIREESYEGQLCFVIERIPLARYSGYSRQILWIDQAEYRIFKIDYHDRKFSLLKTLSYKNYKKYLDRYWRAQEMEMVNQQNGKSALLKWNNYQFQIGLRLSDFTQESLKRVR